ncbi:phosphate acetyltransferase [Planktotalea sp.]|uniref:phosphate acetyltransferase n=1 Tax=Planktotalea sp. TaxID=2029877 RepID=UPI0025D9D2C9|nr:phosphate acetyltransferase [Planktotalea sp.]
MMTRAAAAPKTIAFAEGSDSRIVEAAVIALNAGLIKKAHLVGPLADVEATLATFDLDDPSGVQVHDPKNSNIFETLAARFVEMRAHKNLSLELAQKATLDPLIYAALLVETGRADGSIGGAIATTSDTVRAALQVLGKAKNAPLVSSFFLMILPENHPLKRPAMVFSDCGMVIDPNAQELAGIAGQAADSFAALVGDTPKLGMLSFSTHGSAKHERVTKVQEATEVLKAARPDLIVDGELQLDAALVPTVAASKAPSGALKGAANVLIFPNLDAGNIGYKLAQRFGGAVAIGPVLQGLAKPANDLSRGCSAGDVLAMIAVTALQAETA